MSISFLNARRIGMTLTAHCRRIWINSLPGILSNVHVVPNRSPLCLVCITNALDCINRVHILLVVYVKSLACNNHVRAWVLIRLKASTLAYFIESDSPSVTFTMCAWVEPLLHFKQVSFDIVRPHNMGC